MDKKIMQPLDLAELLDAMPDGVSYLQPVFNDEDQKIVDFEVVYANEKAWHFSNLTGAFKQGIRIIANQVPDSTSYDRTFSQFADVYETGSKQEFTFYHNAHNVYLDAIRMKYEAGVLSIIRERDEQQQSASFLQEVIDQAKTSIFLIQPVNAMGSLVDFRVKILNRIMAEYAQQKPENITGDLMSKWFPGYVENGLFDRLATAFKTGNADRFEFHYNVDGIDAWFDITAAPLYEDLLVTCTDYTPLRQLQQDMELSVEGLKQSNTNLEQFAYVASHDLQEPLRKIQAFGDILNGRYRDALGTDGGDLIRRMQSAASRMQVLIEDLLTYSRVSATSKTFESVDLNLLLKEVLIDLEASIKEQQAIINIGALQPIHCDPLQLRQLFQNILSNALKFHQPGIASEINIYSAVVTGAASGFKLIGQEMKRMYQLIEIKDNGIGFEQQYAERIFQIFQRLHGRSEYAGTGIGLSIVQKVVENHQGKIKACSKPGEGATFKILLPL